MHFGVGLLGNIELDLLHFAGGEGHRRDFEIKIFMKLGVL